MTWSYRRLFNRTAHEPNFKTGIFAYLYSVFWGALFIATIYLFVFAFYITSYTKIQYINQLKVEIPYFLPDDLIKRHMNHYLCSCACWRAICVLVRACWRASDNRTRTIKTKLWQVLIYNSWFCIRISIWKMSILAQNRPDVSPVFD